jgi:hypothetical protein
MALSSKSSNGCVRSTSVQIGVDLYECKKQNTISRCESYYPVMTTGNTKSGCSSCEIDYYAKEGVAAGGVTPYASCEKHVIPRVNSANCAETKIAGNDILFAVPVCVRCNSGFKPAGILGCIPEVKGSIPNCEWHVAANLCAVCKTGYLELLGACVPYVFKGCTTLIGTVCERCDNARSYYAVDVGANESQVCMFNTMIHKLSALILILMALF